MGTSAVSKQSLLSSNTVITVNQTAHGFTTGQAVYYTGSTWALAEANSPSTLGIGVVSVIDGNDFNLYVGGQILGLSGLTAGQYYYVSDQTAGLLQTTEPTSVNSYSNPLMFAVSTTSAIVLPFRPSGVVASPYGYTPPIMTSFSGSTSITTSFQQLVTTTVNVGANCLVHCKITGLSAGANTVYGELHIDGTAVAGQFNETVTNGAGFGQEFHYAALSLSAGTHTFALFTKAGSGGNSPTINTATISPEEGATLTILPTNGTGSLSGLAANRPTATGSGITYYCTDMPVLYFDNPNTVSWQQFASEYMPAPAVGSSYTVVPASTISLTNFADAIRALQSSANSGNNNAALLASGSLGATAAWTVTLVASVNSLDANFVDFGVCVSNGTTSGTSVAYAMSFAIQQSTTFTNAVTYLHAVEVTLGTTTRNAVNNECSPANAWVNTQRQHFRLLNDGTTLHFQVSPDGFNWQDWYSQASVSGLTNYGFYFGGGTGSNNYGQANIYENSLGTPTQYTASAATNASPSVITIGAHTILPGDLVAIHGATGNTGINTTGTGSNGLAAAVIVTAVTTTSITTTQNGNGTYNANTATVTLLSR